MLRPSREKRWPQKFNFQLKVRLQQEHSRVLAENKLLQEQILQSMRLQEKLKQQALLLHQRQRLTTAAILEGSTTPNTLLGMASNQILRVVPNKAAKQTTSLTQESVAESADPFYSPILEKVDKIMSGIGFTEEPCRERLICSMYKNPQKFSPYSNLISTQLSRWVVLELFIWRLRIWHDVLRIELITFRIIGNNVADWPRL